MTYPSTDECVVGIVLGGYMLVHQGPLPLPHQGPMIGPANFALRDSSSGSTTSIRGSGLTNGSCQSTDLA